MRQMSQISMDIYRSDVEPNLTQRESWVLEAVEELGVASTETVADYRHVGVNVISGRMTGLRKKGLIEPAHRGVNKFGRTVQFWRPKLWPQ